MIRKIIRIDKEKCTGCGLCAGACHEGAIGMVNGKARLLREDYCDGLGDCLPACPAGAIAFEEREALAYNEQAVQEAKRLFVHLTNWPVQIKLMAANASCLDGADLLVAADCTAYAYRNFHQDFIQNKVTVIGCPKLDSVDYAEKLSALLQNNDVKSVTVARMEVPCCGGMENAVKRALAGVGKSIPWSVATSSADGKILRWEERR